MIKPYLYDKYLSWCKGEDELTFENASLEELQECMKYEEHLKSKKGKVIKLKSTKE